MKVELKASGTIVITSETEVESYALEKWGKENFDGKRFKPEKILIDFSFER